MSFRCQCGERISLVLVPNSAEHSLISEFAFRHLKKQSMIGRFFYAMQRKSYDVILCPECEGLSVFWNKKAAADYYVASKQYNVEAHSAETYYLTSSIDREAIGFYSVKTLSDLKSKYMAIKREVDVGKDRAWLIVYWQPFEPQRYVKVPADSADF